MLETKCFIEHRLRTFSPQKNSQPPSTGADNAQFPKDGIQHADSAEDKTVAPGDDTLKQLIDFVTRTDPPRTR